MMRFPQCSHKYTVSTCFLSLSPPQGTLGYTFFFFFLNIHRLFPTVSVVDPTACHSPCHMDYYRAAHH